MLSKGLLRFKLVKENKDGSETYDVEYNDEAKTLIKKHYKRKRFTPKLLEKAVIEGLENYLKLKQKKDK